MKVVILAAGQSKRLKPIEDKNFVEFLGKPLLQHQLEQLVAVGLRDFVVVGGAHNLAKIKTLVRLMRANGGLKAIHQVKIVEQKILDGMANALLPLQKIIGDEPMLIVSANDVVDGEAFRLILKQIKDARHDSLLVAKKVKTYFPGGYLKIQNGLIKGIVEKPAPGKEPSNMVNLVIHFHRRSKELFETLNKITSKRDDRYEMALDQLMKKNWRVKAVAYDGFWQPIKYPWHVLEVAEYFLGKIAGIGAKYGVLPNGKTFIDRTLTSFVSVGKNVEIAKSAVMRGKNIEIAPSAVVRGPVVLEDGVRVLENAVIVGPAYIGQNTVIATNALVRSSHVGADCVIGFGTEVARSYLGNNVWTHSNYIGDSIIGNDVSFGAGTVTGNLRLDEGNIAVNIQGTKIDSGRNKLGVVIGDHVRCGINTSLMPGIKIGCHTMVGAGIIVNQDISDHEFVYSKTELVIKPNKARLDTQAREKMHKKLA